LVYWYLLAFLPKAILKKENPTKPVAKRAQVAVSAQNVLEQQNSKFVKITIGEATQLAPLKRGCNSRESGKAVRQRGLISFSLLLSKQGCASNFTSYRRIFHPYV
jgi:hypothetical protein